MRKFPIIVVLLLVLAAGWWSQRPVLLPSARPASIAGLGSADPAAGQRASLPGFLPSEARATLARIERGGPFRHPQDGGIFGNREKQLPQKPRGYYREYTVETPGLSHRGARRIVTGGQPPAVYYYTDDHYDSFRSFRVAP